MAPSRVVTKRKRCVPSLLSPPWHDCHIKTVMMPLVAGERRWRAAQLANLKTIPALLLPQDLDKDEISLIENIQRENLKISEEAQAYQRLIDKNKYTHEELSKIVGKSRSHITNLLRILSLDKYFLNLLNKGVISMGHARALVGKSPNEMDEKILNQMRMNFL